jgi:hypothetical protein
MNRRFDEQNNFCHVKVGAPTLSTLATDAPVATSVREAEGTGLLQPGNR